MGGGLGYMYYGVCTQEKKLVEKREKKEGEDDVKGLESDEKEEPVMSPHDQETAPNIHELTPSSMETTNEGMPTSMEATPTANEATPTEAAAPEAESPLPEEEDPITVASRLRWQRHTNTTSMEKTFSSLSISRTLYTLSAVLPQDMSVGYNDTPFAGMYFMCVVFTAVCVAGGRGRGGQKSCRRAATCPTRSGHLYSNTASAKATGLPCICSVHGQGQS